MYPLTGCPQQQYFHPDIKDTEGYWQRIYTADKRKYPMCSCTFANADKDVNQQEMREAGLVDSHAYTLVAAREIILDDLSTARLVKIRNPYGQKEWTGDWSDNSKKWTVRTRA